MVFVLCILHHKIDGIQTFKSIGLLVSEILIFLLIFIFKLRNVPCALGFEVKQIIFARIFFFIKQIEKILF